MPKTAGRSISNCLSRRDFDKCSTSHIDPTLRFVESQFKCEGYFKFCFVRNPWDRAVSAYHYVMKHCSAPPIPLNITFSDFISEYDRFNPEIITHYSRSQIKWILDKNNEINIDFIGRFERLQEDFNILCDKIKIPRQQLPHINAGPKRKHYSKYYDDKTREIVAKKFAKDIEYFGYEFGE